MLRSTSGYSRAGRSNRADLTRRGLLGVAAVLAGAGVADILHKPGKGNAVTPRQVSNTTARNAAKSVNESRPVTPATSNPPARPTSARHGRSGAHHDHAHHAKNASNHRGHHHDGHHHAHDHQTAHERRQARAERVTLPAAQVKVRDRPIFYVDQLIKDAPKHAIALTVDDGPDPQYTPKVLRLLDKYQMQASFCVVGVHADAYPRLIRDIARAGHVIVNHSYTHVQPFNHQTEQRVVDEITKTQRAIEKAAKVTPELFRAPGGAWSPFIFRAVAAYGLTPLDWDVDPLDWEMPGKRYITKAMLKGRPNDIVLCHDGGGDRIETVRALRKVLPTWKHRGYVTVPLIVPASVKLTPRLPPIAPSSSPAVSPSATNQSASTSPTP